MNDYPTGTEHRTHELFDVLGPSTQGPLVELRLHVTPAMRADPWLFSEIHLAISEILIHHGTDPTHESQERRTD